MGWIAPDFSDPNFGDEVMESENFALFANEYKNCQILTFCKVSQMQDDQVER